MAIPFNILLEKTHKNDPNWTPPVRLLCLDPGETLGWAVYDMGELRERGHIDCKYRPYAEVRGLLEEKLPTQLVCEDYRVYGNKTDAHTWSDLFTPKLIGGISMWADTHGIPIHYQMAATVKPFCSPLRLREWGFWKEAHRHAMDAVKHGAYYLLFHGRNHVGGKE